jgi:hypothetical protein
MIIKLCRAGVTRHIECVDVLQQTTANNTLDLEVLTPKGESVRVLIGNREIFAVGEEQQWGRAYIMENGRTVDTIRAPDQTPYVSQIETRDANHIASDEAAEAARITAECHARRNSYQRSR